MSKLLERELTNRDVGTRAARVDEGAVTSFVNGFTEENDWQQRKENEVRFNGGDSGQLNEMRKKFYNAMSETIRDDKDGTFKNIVPVEQGFDDGRVAQTVLDDLRDFKTRQLLEFEDNMKNARLPTEDLFGVKRHFCTVCESGCKGYEPNSQLVPLPGEFPTFCKNCKCPAHFHRVAVLPEDIRFPEGLHESIKSHALVCNDLNFNCIFMAYQIRDQLKKGQNVQELVTLLRDEGLEVVSIAAKNLEVEEAIFLKARMVAYEEKVHRQQKREGGGKQRVNEILDSGARGSAFLGKHGYDAYQMKQQADLRQERLAHQTKRTSKERDGGPSKDRLDTINQRVPLKEIVGEMPKASIVRSSFGSAAHFNDIDRQIADETMNIIRRESLIPAIKDRYFKLKTYSKHAS
jgi:hypothetical protein